MQIVIDIPEEAYKLLKNDGVDWLGAEHILNAVANGTPLPDGAETALLEASPQPCGDCISRQEVLDALNKSKYSNDFCKEHHIDWSINLSIARIVVNELKPVAPQSKMGRWVLKKDIDGKTYGVCSECGGIQYAGYLNYCPYCGIKMQEVEE
jgi:hypothetical protein